jgi:transaldolase
MPLRQQVVEIAFILNARHGLRLAQKFGGFVSVELHTDTAHDLEAIVKTGLRYAEIDPQHFIIKVPYTVTGLLGARMLHERGVRVNFTLGFSARQNLFATALAHPDYVNVFLGRLGAYCKDNSLGRGDGVGERAVLSSQKWVKKMNLQYSLSTKLIAASLRSAAQLAIDTLLNLAGLASFKNDQAQLDQRIESIITLWIIVSHPRSSRSTSLQDSCSPLSVRVPKHEPLPNHRVQG